MLKRFSLLFPFGFSFTEVLYKQRKSVCVCLQFDSWLAEMLVFRDSLLCVNYTLGPLERRNMLILSTGIAIEFF